MQRTARWCFGVAAMAATASAAIVLAGQPRTATPAAQPEAQRQYANWNDYGGSPDSMQYSALDQVNRDNVSTLQQAWFYPVEGDAVRIAFNPLIIDDVMYVRGAKGRLVALDARSGKEIWRSAEEAFDRGVSYWESADRSDRRLMVTTNLGLRQVDARTGKLIATFGVNGTLDMRSGSPRLNGGPSKTPGKIFENLLIVGSQTGEGFGSPSGDIRAYDVRTGTLVWTFHTVPRPGEFGYDTWPPEAYKYAGGANNWGEMTIDHKHGLVFVPLGSPTQDFYGADRAGDNLFGNCLVALDARTGKRKWHFQTVHHDLWDYDLAPSPKLLTVRHNGRNVDIVAQAGKTGFLYVFERVSGKPLWPIEERPVRQSEIPGEKSSPTQPFPTKPEPFARQSFKVEDVNPYVPAEEQENLKQAVREALSDGLFTPSSDKQHHIQFPGAWGGANWGSVAADPATGMVYVRSLEMPSYRQMSLVKDTGRKPPAIKGGEREKQGYETYVQICSACHGPGGMPMRSPATVGSDAFRKLVRGGQSQMPAFSEDVIPAARLEALEAFLLTLSTNDDDDRGDANAPLRLPPNPSRYQGPEVRYTGSFSAGWYTANGLPASGPPWTQLVAYDLNDGTVKWRIPDGTSPGLFAQGIKGTGSVRPKNGPVVTAGGLVIIANDQDRMLRAYDKANGKLLWEHEIPANPEGIPAVYQIDGRQYIAFSAGASWGSGGDPIWRKAFHRKQSDVKDQGYYVFALPQQTSTTAAFERAPDALEKVSWRTRTLVGDDKLTRWKLAIRPDRLSLLDSVVRADAAIVNFVEGRSGQPVGRTIAKPLGPELSAGEIASIRAAMGTIGLLTYRAEKFDPDAAAQRKVLEFAKALKVQTVVIPLEAKTPASASASVPAAATLGTLATTAKEVDINVALLPSPDNLAALVKTLDGQDPHLGVGIDTGAWLEQGRAPVDALGVVGDRLRYVNLRDRAAMGVSSRNVKPGEGAGKLSAFFDELNTRNIRPLSLTLDTTSLIAAPADLFAVVDAFEKTVQPAYGRFFTAYSQTRPIRWDLYTPGKNETLTGEQIKVKAEEAGKQVMAALPKAPFAKPKKARTMLVIESLHGMSHNTIPHTNLMLQKFGETTGAWKTVFDNDLANLLPANISKYDAIFLNDIVGEAFAEPAVRESLLQYVKNGGGLIGIHGTPWASRNWTEFTEMIGAMDAPHRIEQGIIRVYDPASPLVKPLGGKPLNFKEEYYRFHIEGHRRLRWNNVRVLLTVDLDDPAIEPRPWDGYKRSDKIYPVSWVRNYGKGRVFYTSIGHMPETFMTPELVGHILSGVQFALGDLDADATPNPPGAGSVSSR